MLRAENSTEANTVTKRMFMIRQLIQKRLRGQGSLYDVEFNV